MMNILRRNSDRRHIRSNTSDMWLTFFPEESAGSLNNGFGAMSIFNEIRLPSNEDIVSSLESDSDLVTYVHKGTLALMGPWGRSGIITAGEFQCMTVGRVSGQKVTNTSPTDLALFFRIFFRLSPSSSKDGCVETPTRFTSAQRRNVLCIIASPVTRKVSLYIHTDACIYSSILDPGQHIVHELLPGRMAWIHIVYGRVLINEAELTAGDGMGVIDEPSVSLTARENSELLLVDTTADTGRNHS